MRFRCIKKRWGLGRGKDKRKADLGDGRGGGLTQRTPTVLARVGAQQTERTQTLLPERISRYRVRRLLGEGAFGRVFLALDEELQRLVAVKVPRALCPPNLKTEAFLQEARRVASLDHPAIVPAYDVGHTTEGQSSIVSKYIEGINLASKIQQQKLDARQVADLLAIVAGGLSHAHTRGVVHRVSNGS